MAEINVDGEDRGDAESRARVDRGRKTKKLYWRLADYWMRTEMTRRDQMSRRFGE